MTLRAAGRPQSDFADHKLRRADGPAGTLVHPDAEDAASAAPKGRGHFPQAGFAGDEYGDA